MDQTVPADEILTSDPSGCPALVVCRQQGFDPAEALATQFLIDQAPSAPVPGLRALPMNAWVLHHGRAVELTEMRDAQGRMFGAFLGIGVDPDGQIISAASFAAFDLDAPDFLPRFEHFVAYTAGRYAVVLDCPAGRHVYHDPVAHLTVVYHPQSRRVASSVMLALNRPLQPNPRFDSKAIAQATAKGDTEPNFILGHTQDAEVKFCLPNHRLDLDTFAPARIWPLPDSFPPAEPEEYDALVARMVARLKAILGALITARPSILPVSGGTDSRKLLACLTDRLDEVAELFAFEHTNYAKLDATTGEWVVSHLLGRPFHRYTASETAPYAPQSPFDKRRFTRLFWLRTSSVAKPPNEHLLGMTAATPPGHLHLRGNVMDLMRGVWWGSFAGRNTKVGVTLREEISSLFLNPEPGRDLVEKWAEDYHRWKLALPANAQPVIYDFIFLELFLHVSSAKYYGYERNFYICPFSDRSLIEMTLRFPIDFRFAGTLNEMFLRAADPALADQPYRGGVRDLIKRGDWAPANPG
ncbi:MAG: hypothetical protein ACK4S2_09155 [Gemmobacter sp.]|uniref:hypothetical protein n=1 Tax=Gemmobacter sp. TaxID=1898957 RepID=UPI00391D914F